MSRVSEVKDEAEGRLKRLRRRYPLLDHLIRMNQHYGRSNASQQAGAVTYFAFLSFFPILAVGFFVVGYVAKVYPGARGNLTDAIGQVLPGLIGTGKTQISLESIQGAAGAVGIIGVVGLLYSGLGWLDSMRTALNRVFEVAPTEQPSWIIGKLRDLVTLVLVGLVLMVSVAVSGVVTSYARQLLGWLSLGTGLEWLVWVISIALGIGSSMVLFYAMFRLLAAPDLPRRALWSGALLGALGFEVLKQLSSFLLASTKHEAAFQAFGIALILLVWINYFSRVVLYAASWAQTGAGRVLDEAPLANLPAAQGTSPRPARTTAAVAEPAVPPAVSFAAGSAVTLAVVSLVRRARQSRR